MKLWRRRPLSVDLTNSDPIASKEMPPSLIYISPGVHSISKRSSLISNEIITKPQFISEVSSFNPSENCLITANTNPVDNYPLQSFRDYTNATAVSFDEGTLRSTRLSNKSYISPVSAEWLPVKDIMKIKRSASVPFHSQKNLAVISQPIISNPPITVKSHTSLAEKIRTLFRTRSSSRSSKALLTPITELMVNKEKIIIRNSRTRTKGIESCKSMYESSKIQDQEFTNKLNNVLRDAATRPMETQIDNSSRKVHMEKSSKKKDKLVIDKKEKSKNSNMLCEAQKMPNAKGFSNSVVSHTASSAAKCKSSPPKTSITHRLRSSAIYRQSDSSQLDKKSIIKSNSCKYEVPPVTRPLSSQPITTTNYDKKNCELNKSDSTTQKTGKVNNEKVIQKECLLSNQSNLPSDLCVKDRQDMFERTTSLQRPEDDYVTLADMDMQLSFMTHSIHGPIIRELAKSNHEYENIDLKNVHSQDPPVILKYSNCNRDSKIDTALIQHKQRPISCIAVAETEKSKNKHHNNRYYSREPPGNMNPKSPYLSQYTKLYSLKVTNGEIFYSTHHDPSDGDIMTRSQTSCMYRTPGMLGKEISGKRSIDSGLVEDLSLNYHGDSIIQT